MRAGEREKEKGGREMGRGRKKKREGAKEVHGATDSAIGAVCVCPELPSVPEAPR